MTPNERLDAIGKLLATVDSNREYYEEAKDNMRDGLPTNEATNLMADEYRLAVIELKAAAPQIVRELLGVARAAVALEAVYDWNSAAYRIEFSSWRALQDAIAKLSEGEEKS